MDTHTEFNADLTVRSFAYAAKQLAQTTATLTPGTRYELILREADKYHAALRLIQRDVREMTEQGLRKQTMTNAEFHRLREAAAQTVAHAQQAITRIIAQYAPHKLAA